MATASSGPLSSFYSVTGQVSDSVDGVGTLNSSGTVRVQKPSGATVRAAFLLSASTGFTQYQEASGDVQLDGNGITWTTSIANSISSYNYWADVTSIVKPKVDAAAPGTVTFTVSENNTVSIDGEILAVVFDDPSQPSNNTVSFLFGAQNVAGDTFNVSFASPVNTSDPNFHANMSLGISYSYQAGGSQQYSIVNLNGQRLTTSAGGEDDQQGTDGNGALLTVGGIGDSTSNPPDPNATPTGPRSDDELYDLTPFIKNGDTSLSVYTQNPSNDDNIFFAAFATNPPSAVTNTSANYPSTQETRGRGSPTENQTTKSTDCPVNCATGEFWHTFGDFSIPGRGVPLDFNHTYSSLGASQDSPLGFGWTDSYNMFLSTDASGNVSVHEEGGSVIPFAKSGSGYQPPPRVLGTLFANADSTLTFTRLQGQDRFVFSAPTQTAAGQLLKEIDRNGYTSTLSYTNGLLSSVTDPASRSLSITYNTGNRIAQITDSANRSVSFSYDASANLTDVIDVGGGHWHFSYDANHRLLTMEDPNQYAAHGAISTGAVLTNVYDSQGRVTSQTDPIGRQTTFAYTQNSDGSETTTITDPKGNVTTEVYLNNELQRETDGAGTAQAATRSYQFDPAVLGVTQVTDPNGHVWKATWDSQGNVLSRTDPLTRTTLYAYDSLNDPTSVTDASNVKTTLSYDGSGNPLSVSHPIDDAGTTLLTKNGSFENGSTPWQPTKVSQLIASTNPHSGTHSLQLCGTNNCQQEAYQTLALPSTSDRITLSFWAEVNGPLPGPGDTCIGDYLHARVRTSTGSTISTVQDLCENTSPGWQHYVYDLTSTLAAYTGQSIQVYFQGTTDATYPSTFYLDDVTLTRSTNATAVTNLAYGDGTHPGDVTSVSDPNQHTTSYQYDGNGNLVKGTDPAGDVTTAAYDGIGRMTSMVSPKGNVIPANPAAYTTTIAYNPFGDVTSVTDPLGRNTTYQYDANRNRTALTDALNHTTSSVYDADDELSSVTQADNTTLSFGYDADGNTLSQTDGLNRTTGYAYDALNRVSSMTDPLNRKRSYAYDLAGNLTSTVDALNRTTSYGYDAADELTSVSYPDGVTPNVSYGYDVDGRRSSMADGTGTSSYSYDSRGLLVGSISGAGQEVDNGYDLAGNLTSLTYPDTSQVTRSYDAADRDFDTLSRSTSIT